MNRPGIVPDCILGAFGATPGLPWRCIGKRPVPENITTSQMKDRSRHTSPRLLCDFVYSFLHINWFTQTLVKSELPYQLRLIIRMLLLQQSGHHIHERMSL